MDKVRAYFDTIITMSDADWKIFSSKLIRSEHRKKATLLQQGKVEKQLRFIEKGSIRLFIPKEENDFTFGFCFQGQFMSAYDSFLAQEPCSYYAETMSETVIWSLDFDDLQDIYQTTDVGQMIGRKIAEQLFLTKSRREQSLLNQSAEERYLALFTDQPHLIREIPLKYLASYIGITPQALSRIRKRIS